MMKTISEAQGTIGEKKISKKTKKSLDKDVKQALMAASSLMKDIIGSPNPSRLNLCLDLKRKLEEIEKEYSVTII